MKLVITGGAGFVGNHLARYLVSKGHSVSIIDNLHSGNMKNLSDLAGKVDFHNMDILDYENVRSVVRGADGVFHEAALTVVQESYAKPEEYHKVNVIGTENIFKLAKEFGIKVVFASSSSVYGNPQSIPIKEDAARNPLNPYGKTKLDDEVLAERYAKEGAKIIGMRYFNIFGEGQSISYAGVITKFLENIRNRQAPVINGDGLQIRDFVYVQDVARANLLAMEKDIGSSFVNIGSGRPTSIVDLAQMMIEESGLGIKPVFAKPLPGDVNQSLADVGLAKSLLGWSSKIELREWLGQVLSGKN